MGISASERPSLDEGFRIGHSGAIRRCEAIEKVQEVRRAQAGGELVVRLIESCGQRREEMLMAAYTPL